MLPISVADLDPSDPYLFGPPGSGSLDLDPSITEPKYGSKGNLDSYCFVNFF
jgi:hypothetical protein